jgi:hypothetical protein
MDVNRGEYSDPHCVDAWTLEPSIPLGSWNTFDTRAEIIAARDREDNEEQGLCRPCCRALKALSPRRLKAEK